MPFIPKAYVSLVASGSECNYEYNNGTIKQNESEIGRENGSIESTQINNCKYHIGAEKQKYFLPVKPSGCR